MRITETQLRRIIRQEADRTHLTEMAAGGKVSAKELRSLEASAQEEYKETLAAAEEQALEDYRDKFTGYIGMKVQITKSAGKYTRSGSSTGERDTMLGTIVDVEVSHPSWSMGQRMSVLLHVEYTLPSGKPSKKQFWLHELHPYMSVGRR